MTPPHFENMLSDWQFLCRKAVCNSWPQYIVNKLILCVKLGITKGNVCVYCNLLIQPINCEFGEELLRFRASLRVLRVMCCATRLVDLGLPAIELNQCLTQTVCLPNNNK